MQERIFFMEGIPGSGKTTRASALSDKLRREGKTVHSIMECEKNELDLARCAVVTEQQLQRIREKLEERDASDPQVLERELRELALVSERFGEKICIFYQSLFSVEGLSGIAMGLSDLDVYNGHYSFEEFRRMHLRRWRDFSSRVTGADAVHVCDAVLLQSPLFELLGYYELPMPEILGYISELIDCVKALSPMIIYNYVSDVPGHTRRVCAQRERDGDPWERGFYRWMERSPYCRKRAYRGFDGMCAFFSERQSMELQILKRLPVPHRIRTVDWDR